MEVESARTEALELHPSIRESLDQDDDTQDAEDFDACGTPQPVCSVPPPTPAEEVKVLTSAMVSGPYKSIDVLNHDVRKSPSKVHEALATLEDIAPDGTLETLEDTISSTLWQEWRLEWLKKAYAWFGAFICLAFTAAIYVDMSKILMIELDLLIVGSVVVLLGALGLYCGWYWPLEED